MKETAEKIVIIGSSSGGPKILEQIFRLIQGKTTVPILIVQHMNNFFTGEFAERLNKTTGLQIKEAINGDKVIPGKIYLAPGGFQMKINRDQIEIAEDPPFNNYRPSIDVLMISAAKTVLGKITGIILTGMGTDGLQGAQAIKEAEGEIIAQSPESCPIASMPSSIISAGLADQILDPDAIASYIIQLSK